MDRQRQLMEQLSERLGKPLTESMESNGEKKGFETMKDSIEGYFHVNRPMATKKNGMEDGAMLVKYPDNPDPEFMVGFRKGMVKAITKTPEAKDIKDFVDGMLAGFDKALSK